MNIVNRPYRVQPEKKQKKNKKKRSQEYIEIRSVKVTRKSRYFKLKVYWPTFFFNASITYVVLGTVDRNCELEARSLKKK